MNVSKSQHILHLTWASNFDKEKKIVDVYMSAFSLNKLFWKAPQAIDNVQHHVTFLGKVKSGEMAGR